MNQYFPAPNYSESNVRRELDLTSYAAKDKSKLAWTVI